MTDDANRNPNPPSPAPSGSELLNGIRTEITAGMVILPLGAEERTWNRAHQRCLNIIELYARGEGLFQMTIPNAAGEPQPRKPRA